MNNELVVKGLGIRGLGLGVKWVKGLGLGG